MKNIYTLMHNRAKQLSLSSRLLIVCGVIFVAAVVITAVTFENRSSSAAAGKKTTAAIEKNKDALRSQVDTTSGTPQDGRDPSMQQQTSLESAMSTPNVAGTRTSKPAAGVTGDTNHHVTHGDVYGDPAQTGVNSAGCLIDYGIRGEQCLPAGLRSDDGMLSCDKVRTRFADGIKVTGVDRFHLDHNGDGLACGAGE